MVASHNPDQALCRVYSTAYQEMVYIMEGDIVGFYWIADCSRSRLHSLFTSKLSSCKRFVGVRS
jgi:hypothetical protein